MNTATEPIWYDYTLIRVVPRVGFSELWLVQPTDAAASTNLVEVGLRSRELQPTRFRLQVIDGDRVALDEADIQLTPGQAWQASLPLSLDLTAPGSIVFSVPRLSRCRIWPSNK